MEVRDFNQTTRGDGAAFMLRVTAKLKANASAPKGNLSFPRVKLELEDSNGWVAAFKEYSRDTNISDL